MNMMHFPSFVFTATRRTQHTSSEEANVRQSKCSWESQPHRCRETHDCLPGVGGGQVQQQGVPGAPSPPKPNNPGLSTQATPPANNTRYQESSSCCLPCGTQALATLFPTKASRKKPGIFPASSPGTIAAMATNSCPD